MAIEPGGEALLLARESTRRVGPAFYHVGIGSIGLRKTVSSAAATSLQQSLSQLSR